MTGNLKTVALYIADLKARYSTKEELVTEVADLKKRYREAWEEEVRPGGPEEWLLLLLQNLEAVDERYAAANARLRERAEDPCQQIEKNLEEFEKRRRET